MQNITLRAALTTMPAQEVFDIVTKHLLTQNKKSKRLAGVACLYRGPENTMCAVGCLVSDEEYDEEFEELGSLEEVVGIYYSDLVEQHGDVYGIPNYSLLQDLQQIHDGYSTDEWADTLKRHAAHAGLNFNAL